MKSPFREKLLAGPHLPWGWKAISSPEKAANAWVQGNPSRLCDWDGWKLLLFPRSGLNTSFLWDGHLDTFSHCMSCWLCWNYLLSMWTIVLSFKAADYSLMQVASSLWVENPPLTMLSSVLCCCLIFFLIWYLMWLINFIRMVLLWTLKPCAALVAVWWK